MTPEQIKKEINVLKKCLPEPQKFQKESYAREYMKEKFRTLRELFPMKLKSSDCFPNAKVVYREVWDYLGYELMGQIADCEVYFTLREE